MATFQFRVVGNYFGSPLTTPPEFSIGKSVTGPVTVTIDPSVPASAITVDRIMQEIKQMSLNNQINNCSLFTYEPSSEYPDGEKTLRSITVKYTESPYGGGQPATIQLAERLDDPSADLVLQYYLYEFTETGDHDAPLIQYNRAGDRKSFQTPLSQIGEFNYKPDGAYFIVWRMVYIATSATQSARLNARVNKIIQMG
ncbi:MAG: hypothetical protein MRZ79_08685 [Bacteroidia bacterium]|nr:hypothetical protein [Bacteroidia bacterium]